jgi:DNA-binding NarL/FixJ family response regulator
VEKIRIIVVDDHQIVREGIVAVLAREADIEIVGEGSNGAEALNLVRQRKPDVVLLDAQMPGLSGAETIKAIAQISPRTYVIVLSMHDSEYIVLQMLRAGARSYLLKGAKSGEVVQAIRDTVRGASYLSPAIARTVLDSLTYTATGRGGEEDLTAASTKCCA